jgi:hypothetical protein
MRARCDDDTRKKVARIPSKSRLRTLDDLDQRTASARRARELVDGLTEDLGGRTVITVAVRQLIQRAAILGAFLADIETRWLQGEAIAADDYFVAINAQRRVLASLGLKRIARDVTPTVSEYIKRNAKVDIDADEWEVAE